MTIWPGSQTVFPGSAIAAGAQSNPSVAPAANSDATFDREGRIVMHPLFVEGDDRLRVEADV